MFLPASIEAQRIRLVDLTEGETSEGGPVGRADRDQPHAAAVITAPPHGKRPAAAPEEAAEPLTALVRLLARQAAAEVLAAGDTTTFDEEPA